MVEKTESTNPVWGSGFRFQRVWAGGMAKNIAEATRLLGLLEGLLLP